MHSELSNLYLFALAIAKLSLTTGFGPGLLFAIAMENAKARTYIFRWAKCLGMPVLDGTRKGQPCRVLVRGGLNSCLIEFPDGLKAVTSRNALRRVH